MQPLQLSSREQVLAAVRYLAFLCLFGCPDFRSANGLKELSRHESNGKDAFRPGMTDNRAHFLSCHASRSTHIAKRRPVHRVDQTREFRFLQSLGLRKDPSRRQKDPRELLDIEVPMIAGRMRYINWAPAPRGSLPSCPHPRVRGYGSGTRIHRAGRTECLSRWAVKNIGRCAIDQACRRRFAFP